MKKLISSTLTAAMIFVASITLPTKVLANNNIGQILCEVTAADDKKRLRSALKQRGIKLRSIFKDLRCNNRDLLHFAADRNALEVGKMIVGKLPKKLVKKSVADMPKESPLYALAAKRAGV